MLLKENADLLVRWDVRLMRTTRRHRAAISLIVHEMWLNVLDSICNASAGT